jgi:NAD+ kinase
MSAQQSETRSEPPRAAASRVTVVTHGRAERIGDALERLRKVAGRCGVSLVDDDEAEMAVVLGGDGTMLRALQRFLGRPVPCLGVNFGRVGFLTSIQGSELETGLERAFRGEFETIDLPTIEAFDGGGFNVTGINDVVLASGILGRMVIVQWSVEGVTMGELGCDGSILATPTGSTAYNLSAGGPVLAWGTDAFVISFVSPHSLHARSMVLGRRHTVELQNLTPDVPLHVIVDGHDQERIEPGGVVTVRMSDRYARLARLPATSFFSRYRDTFSH